MPQQVSGQYNVGNRPYASGQPGEGADLPIKVDSQGNVSVTPASGASFGASSADGSTFTSGTSTGGPIQGVRQDSPTTVADGKVGTIRISSTRAIKTDMDTALSKTIDSITVRPEASTYTNITASTLIRTGAGILVGMYVNSTSSGTIKFWDQTSAAVPVLNNTITPAIGYHPLGNAAFATGLYATIASTLDVTIYYIPTP